MNIRQIEMFKAVVECGSVTEAARRLCVSQPAVSKMLQLLERDLGFRVFLRTPKGLEPTQEARALYAEVERAFISMEYLAGFARDLRNLRDGRLVVSAIHCLSTGWLPQITAAFLQAYPQVNLSFQAWDSPRTAKWVEEGQIDIGIAQLRARTPAIRHTHLMDLDAVCVLPPGHRLAGRGVVTPELLEGETFLSLSPTDEIRIAVDRLVEARGIRLRSSIDAAMGATLCGMVEQGLGIGIVDSRTAADHRHRAIVIRPFEPRISMSVYLLRSERRAASLLADRFAEHLMDSANGEAGHSQAAGGMPARLPKNRLFV